MTDTNIVRRKLTQVLRGGRAMIAAAAIIGGSILFVGLASPGHGETTAAAASIYQIVTGGEGVFAWRLNTQTGEMIACRLGGQGGAAGAACWPVSNK